MYTYNKYSQPNRQWLALGMRGIMVDGLLIRAHQ